MLRFVLFCAFLALGFAGSDSKYHHVCNDAFCRIIEDAASEVNDLKKLVDEGACIPQYGSKADSICNNAIEKFTSSAPLPSDDNNKDNEAIYDKKIEELEKIIDNQLHVIYLKQISLIRDKAVKNFKASLSNEGSEYEAMMQADEFFRKEIEEATRSNPDWDYSKEVAHLKTTLGEIANKAKKLQEVKLSAAKQTQQAMQYLQMQQQQLQAIQQQIQGSSSPWNVGAAYRVPDTNINLSCTYQQGRGSIQISCVPDESAPLLGPNGFVNGVTPGNLGLSFNINI